MLSAQIGCDSAVDDSMTPPGEVAISDLERDLSPSALPGDIDTLIAGNTAFAADAYRQLSVEPGNLFYSPLSVSIAMAMTYGGARGDTAQQMADVLGYELSQDKLHPAFNWLDLQLSSRGQGAQGSDGEGFRLNVINNTFGQRGYSFEAEYLDLIAQSYGTGLSLLDFESDPDGARQIINDWVAEMTEERIEDLLPDGSIDSGTRLVLANAVYFNAAWKTPFEPEQTAPDVFRTPGGDVTVPMMSGQVESMTHMQGADFQAIGLPYDGDELDMVMIVPDEGTFDAFEQNLDGATLQAIFSGLSSGPYGAISMPSFGFRTKVNMVEMFKELGLIDAFDQNADFSGIDGTRNLVITGIFHEAFIDVNEAGTEAAAATAVVVGETSVPERFVVDRPFVFAIRDIATGTVVFLGRVVDPSAS